MAKYLIEGGKKLSGKVKISGNKNSVLPCLAAALLTDEEVTLKNVPQISDVLIFVEILREVGAQVSYQNSEIKVRAKNVYSHTLSEDKAGSIRASILFVGPLLARFGKVEFSHPGGDVIGKRSIEAHLDGFTQLGFKFTKNDRRYQGSRESKDQENREVYFDEASVTATENLILGSVLGSFAVILKNCAKEPHVVDLCNLLVKMGAKIEGVGTNTLRIIGVKNLTGVNFTIGADYIEFATYAVAAAIMGGEIEIYNINYTDLDPVLRPLEKMGVKITKKADKVTASAGELIAIPKLHTNIWPGFPSDMMSIMIVLATQASGGSLLHDWMYESRMFFVDKLISMGANITIADPHRVLVYGPTPLFGRSLETPDIRAGMALVLAALVAEGKSTIQRSELIERGYEQVVEKLTLLGASIQRVD